MRVVIGDRLRRRRVVGAVDDIDASTDALIQSRHGDPDDDDDDRPRKRGCFFSVDAEVWPAVCQLGVNCATSYIILASGTGADNMHTKCSVNAVTTYTAMSRARSAVTTLIEQRIIARVGGSDKHPVYRLTPAAEYVAPPKLTTARRHAKPAPPALQAPKGLWLPNAIITGVNGETAPIELLRQMQDVTTMRLFVDLHGDQHLRVEGGVRRDVVWETYERTRLGEYGPFNVWRFSDPQRMIGWRGAASCHYRKDAEAEAAEAFSARLAAIEHAGLIEFVPHLVEGDGPDAEIVHAYGIGQSDSLEDQLGRAASEGAYALLTPTSGGSTESHPPALRVRLWKPALAGTGFRRPAGSSRRAVRHGSQPAAPAC